jgi:hypothetical protein
VGIGTATPAFPLHIQVTGAVAARDLLKLENSGATRFRFANTDSGQEWEFKLNSGDDFAINDPGNPGGELILTKTGDLQVLGDVFSNTCSGSPCAPDYVFEDDYALMPLSDLERFVQQNKHLPEIPTADEMSGQVNLSELQLSMLKKIEELTLYVIDLSKENQELKETVQQLQSSTAQLAR